jgi:hypothetical protein
VSSGTSGLGAGAGHAGDLAGGGGAAGNAVVAAGGAGDDESVSGLVFGMVSWTSFAHDGYSPFSGSIAIQAPPDDRVGWGSSDAAGNFEFSLEPGGWSFWIEVTGCAFAGHVPPPVVNVVANEQVTAIVEEDCSSSFGTVSGTALDSAGLSVAGAEVFLVQANDTSNYAPTASASDGTFRFLNVVPGDYFFTPNISDPSVAQDTFVLEPGQDASQTFYVDSQP